MTTRSMMLRSSFRLAPLVALVGAAGCYDEGLEIHDLVGQVVLPKEAATFEFTRAVLDDNGDPVTDPGTGEPRFETEEVTDVRLIGPVYVGLFASVRDDLYSYPYPETGPVTGSEAIGDTYPYGGTTIGDFRYACYEFFSCRMVSGRYESFESIIEWWNEIVGDPILDAGGSKVEVADAFRDTCYQLGRWTSDSEIRITATSDRNGDGEVDAGDLDFVEDGDNFVADFTMYDAEFFEGMTAWAFMERPEPGSFNYDSTCNDQLGYQENTYDQNWRAGTQFQNVLNRPASYTETGDWVSTSGFEWMDPFEPATINLDLQVE